MSRNFSFRFTLKGYFKWNSKRHFKTILGCHKCTLLAQVLAQKNWILMHIAYGIPRFFEYHMRPTNTNIPILHELQG